jgi:TonB family protein
MRFGAIASLAFALVVSVPAFAQPAPTPTPLEGVLAPKLISDSTVSYPEGAKGDARVVLTITVGVDGVVRDVAAAERNEPFSTLAEAAAVQWRFEPATRAGKPIAAKIRMEVLFHRRRRNPSTTCKTSPCVVRMPNLDGRSVFRARR